MRHSSYLEIDLNLLASNVKAVQSRAPAAQMIPMVKADAYGNGLVPISRFLVEECGIKKLGCASLGEALRLVDEAPALKAEVIVFSDTELHRQDLQQNYLNLNITPVLHQYSDVELVLTAPEFKPMPLYLKLDTGMNRLGLSLEELERLAPRLKARGVRHLMTHFACSYYPFRKGDKTDRQMARFAQAKDLLRNAGVAVEETSVANSGAIEQGIGINETHIRPGLMLYGPASVDAGSWQGHQISRLVTKILKTFSVKKGEPVGYGINVAGEDGFIALIPLGYGDGLLTFASGTQLQVKGFAARIFARVNMDMAFLLFAPEVAGHLQAEESIEIWNHDNRVIADIAAQMKTIPYQLMCAISPRIPRVYKVK